MKQIGLLIAALAIGMFLTNPDRHDFEGYLEKKFEEDTEYKSDVGSFFGGLLTGTLAEIIAKKADRQNYLVASIYSFGDGEISIGEAEEGPQRYLGLFSFFIKL